MNYIFISPYFPPNFENFCSKLKEEGVTVLGLGSEPYDTLSDTLKNSLTEYYKVENMEDYNEMLRACGYFAFKYGRISRIESHNEYWLETDAALRTDFNVYGIKDDEIHKIKLKSKMKEVFQTAGIPVAKGRIIMDMDDALRLIEEIGYPVCAKPDNGVGAAYTYKIDNLEDLKFFYGTKPNVPYIMEEFITGEIHTFDGITDRNGDIVFFSSFIFDKGVMEIVNEDLDICYFSVRELAADLVDYGTRTVKAFGIKERFFHLEYFRKPDGSLVALEVNIRPPGGLSVDMFNFSNDADLYSQYAKLIAHGKFDAEFKRPYFCAYAGRKTNKNYQHSIQDILNKYGSLIVHNGVIASIFAAALGDYSFLYRSPDFEVIKEVTKYILEK
ncbi:MAG: carboxylate--amine ligase [Eubacteriaceae bacterium]|nr:carboxylate--amine ligase [Eubacteriaceae bacterium]